MRAFIVGNGISLKHTNLNKLKGEVSFACNNIHLIYPFTDWRTTHYVRAEEYLLNVDVNNWQASIDIHKALGCEMWTNHIFGDFGHPLVPCTHYRKAFNDPDCPHLWHLPRLCSFGSSVNVAVQIAVQIGYEPLYLVGCDLGYQNGKPSHFSAQYEHGHEQDAFYANNNTLAAHMIAARSSPVKIYNSTVGGFLECYERVNFDEI
jgi:hypothetical protein